MPKSTTSSGDTLRGNLRGVALPYGGNVYLALYTADPGNAANNNEATYTGYARVAVPRDTSANAFTDTNPALNPNDIIFGLCTGGTLPETITHAAIVSSASGAGTVLYKAALTTPLVVNVNIAPRINAGSASVQEA